MNKDIQAIRRSREQSGCHCKPLKLDKIGVAKMKIEAVSLGVCSVSEADCMPKAQLTAALKDFLKTYCSCRDAKSSCECFAGEVECGDGCLCSRSCANRSKEGYDVDAVREYRTLILAELAATPSFRA